MTRVWFPWISGAGLAACAVFFAEPIRTFVLVGIMLFFPLIDRAWRIPDRPRGMQHYAGWLILLLVTGALLAAHPQYLRYAISTLFVAALPEEWFFRAYFMTRLQDTRWVQGWQSNVVTSLVFGGLHAITRGWLAGLAVLAPSLFYGWLFRRTRDFRLLVLVHALSNLIYILYLARVLDRWLAV